MSDSDRTAAREMLAESVGKDGKVDLKALKALQWRWANEQKERELETSEFSGVMASTIRSEYVHRIDRATKEVLGIIPESQWHYTDTVLPDVIRRGVELFKSDHVSEYQCNLPKNFNKDQPLSTQGVQCHRR